MSFEMSLACYECRLQYVCHRLLAIKRLFLVVFLGAAFCSDLKKRTYLSCFKYAHRTDVMIVKANRSMYQD